MITINKKLVTTILFVFMLLTIIVLVVVLIVRQPQEINYGNTSSRDSIEILNRKCDSLYNEVQQAKATIIYRDSIRTVVETKYEYIYQQIETTDDVLVLDSIINSYLY